MLTPTAEMDSAVGVNKRQNFPLSYGGSSIAYCGDNAFLFMDNTEAEVEAP